MHLRLLTIKDAGALRGFLKKHPYGTVEQSWEWGVLQSSIPGRPGFHAWGVFEEDVLIGSMLVIRQNMGLGKTWLWCPNGPVLPLEEKGEQAWDLMKQEVMKLAHRYGDVFIRMEPSVNEVSPLVADATPVKTSYLPRNTLVIDLSLSQEEILAQMAQKGRYNIKQADKAGVKVRRGSAKALPVFYEILKETGARDGFHHHPLAFYEAFLKELGEEVELLLAELNGEVIGGMLMVYFGDRATYYFGASANQARQAMAPYALQWHAIEAAKKRGCLEYDFLGIAPEGEEAHPLRGVTQFKTRFGGKRLDYHPAQVIVMRWLWWLLYRLAKSRG